MIRRKKKIHPIVFLSLFIATLIVISNCSVPKDRVLILEDQHGTGFSMDFKKWSSTNKCELFLNKGDEMLVEINLEEGEIGLVIRGEKGTEPYMGNNLKLKKFTVKVSETDRYLTHITGKNVTGKVRVKRVN